jgi:hypothetical protein
MTNLSKLGVLLFTGFLLMLTYSCEEDNARFLSEANDMDGDGVLDSADEAPQDPCLPLQLSTYTGFDVFNDVWAEADCDGDGVANAAEFEDSSRNPYLDENSQDADGDGVADFIDEEPNDPCIPMQEPGYLAFNSQNQIWAAADCDGDLILNIDELNNGTDPYFACNLNFDQSIFLGELRTIDSINGEGLTNGEIGTDCGMYVFSGGGIFNQGCFNDDISIPFLLVPNDAESSEGTVTVALTTYECLSEDGTETIQFSVSGSGTYEGELGRLELNYTMTTPDGDIEGTLSVRSLGDEEDEDEDEEEDEQEDEDCPLNSFEGEYNTIITIGGNEDFGSAVLMQQGGACNDFLLSGDFLNLGCNNDFEISVFLGDEEDGSEVIIEEASFTCNLESGETIDYTFNAFGEYSLAEGFLQLTEFTLSDSNGNTSNGEIFFELSNGDENGGDDEDDEDEDNGDGDDGDGDEEEDEEDEEGDGGNGEDEGDDEGEEGDDEENGDDEDEDGEEGDGEDEGDDEGDEGDDEENGDDGEEGDGEDEDGEDEDSDEEEDDGDEDCPQNAFEGAYNTIININDTERFGNATFTSSEGCGDFTLSGDFLNLGCENTVEIQVFLGAEEDGAEILIENASFTCIADGVDTEYTFTASGSYSSAEGFIELSEFTLTDSSGNQTTGSVFFESL